MNTKKDYIAPAIEIAEIETESLMLASSGELDQVGTGDGTAGKGPELANNRRSDWGNLWN